MEKIKEFWENKTAEDKRKIIVYSIAGVFSFLLLLGVYLIQGRSRTETIAEMENPDAKEVQKYNSRTEANQLGKVDSANMVMDDIFGSSGGSLNHDAPASSAEPYAEPVYTQPDYNRTPVSSGNGGASSAASGYNSHTTYGDYSMWQAEEPRNNSIGYSEVKNYPSTKGKTNNKTMPVSQSPYDDEAPIYSQPEYSTAKPVRKGNNIKAKLISQGYATSGRSLSFVLLEDTAISGQNVKRGTVVTGLSQEQNNRLLVSFSNIKINGKVFPAEMSLLGNDGMPGLPVSQGNNGVTTELGNAAGDEIRNQAGGIVSRVPIIGGVLSSATQRRNNTGPGNAIKLTPNTACYIVVY